MIMKRIIIGRFFVLSLLVFLPSTYSTIFDITQFGAQNNPDFDAKQGVESAWREACKCPTPSTVLIPKGIFLLGETFMFGPCKSSITIQLDGTLKAYEDPNKYKKKGALLTIKYVNGVSILGSGTIDGQGALAWKNCGNKCSDLPVNIRFMKVSNAVIDGITSLDSKHFHCCMGETTNLTISNIKIIAPETSPNTDGIHISHSTCVTVQDSVIQTGDDCVSIIHTNHNITVTRVSCGPGHGVSVGSLGKYKKEGPVNGVTVSQCNFTNTENGIRVKTLPTKQHGSATNINFEDLVMNNVTNPVIIDQTYCPSNNCQGKATSSAIQLSDISFRRIHGSSASPIGVKLHCSEELPCKNVKVEDINLSFQGIGTFRSTCNFVQPEITGVQIPKICSAVE